MVEMGHPKTTKPAIGEDGSQPYTAIKPLRFYRFS